MYPFTRRANSPNNNTSQFTFLYPNNNNNYLPSSFPWEGRVDPVPNPQGLRGSSTSVASNSSLSFSNVNHTTHGVPSTGLSASNTLSMNFGRYTFSHANGVTTFSVNHEEASGPVYRFHGHTHATPLVRAHEVSTDCYAAKRQRPVDSQPYSGAQGFSGFNNCVNEQKTHGIPDTWNPTQQHRTINGWADSNLVPLVNRCQKRTVHEAQMEGSNSFGPHKQFITEDKVAAQLRSLSLSNDHCYHSNGLPSRNAHSTQHLHTSNGSIDLERMDSAFPNDKSSKDKKEQGRKRDWKDLSWEINPAFKDIPKVSPLPKCLLEQINKPCLAIVPWKPPEDFVDQICSKINNDKKGEDADDEDDEDEKLFTYLGDSDEIVHGYDEYKFAWDDSSSDELDEMDMDELTL